MGDPRAVLLPAAVSPLVAAEVGGAPRPCRVLASFPTCLYLELGAHERVLAVLAADAISLPIGLRLALPSPEVRWGVEPGDEVLVGEGRVRLPRAEVVATRCSRPARVRPQPRGSARTLSLPDPGVLGELAHDLTSAALGGRSAVPGVRGLVGVGRGLTPSGDDALCGILLTLGALDDLRAQRALGVVRAAVRDVLPRTTSLSAALLLAAGLGYAVPDVVRLVTLLVGAPRVGEDPADLDDLVGRVLAIGHSSGRDLLSGVSGALRAVDTRHPTSHPHPTEGAHRG
ncbi:MAG: DUF2877 domain-containing protein [Terracoccus sp.]